MHSKHYLQAFFIGTNKDHKTVHMCNLQPQEEENELTTHFHPFVLLTTWAFAH